MTNIRGQSIDKTHLSIDNAEDRGFIHRDYIAHCLRWSHVVKHLGKQSRWRNAKILDIGCGSEAPLAKLLYSSRYIVNKYVGVDLNKPVDRKWGKFPFKSLRMDAAEITTTHLGYTPNYITWFEMIEHIEPEHGLRILDNCMTLLDEGGTMFVSTPCYDPEVGAAGNHVSEYTYQALGYLFERRGWSIENHWGTFASIKDYKSHMEPEHEVIFDDLRDYYDVNLLSCIFAPFYPQYSRNCLWELKPRFWTNVTGLDDSEFEFKFDRPSEDEPWCSSPRWQELLDV